MTEESLGKQWKRLLKEPRWHLIFLVLIILPLYMINARWGTEGNGDAIAVGIAAYQVVNHQTLDLSEYPIISDNLADLGIWYVETPDGSIVSNRAPGLIGLAIPSYALIKQNGYSNGPATVVALLTTVMSVVVSWHVLRGLVGLNAATVAALTLAIGTTSWWVSSSELWPHGPGQLWAALAVLGLSNNSLNLASLAFGLSVLTRPISALFGTITGVLESIRTRRWKPAVVIGVGTAAGVALVLAYNRLVFGSFSLNGGYSSDFTSGAIERFTVGGYLSNVWNMFFGLPNGVLVTTPILGVAVVGSILYRRRIPGWAISAAWSSLGYLMVHSALNRASGGSAVFYRYPLEAIVLAMPCLTIGALGLWNRSARTRQLVFLALVLSIFLQVLHVFILSCWITDPVVPVCVLE